MKPWREVAVPHQDVLEGTFQQSEFAADITAVRTGRASHEYQDAAAFFHRTYITEGMRLLLMQVAQRLSGKGGEPVIQLQTAFGGGKTHTMLAVYHLASRTCPLGDLPGVSALIDKAGIMDVPKARIAVLDGTAHAPGQGWKQGKLTVNTLWGELAWQLGGEEAFETVKEADKSGTSPGKNVLRELLERHAPCVILIDELVAYIRQFPEGQALSGGSYDSNLSFVQALTEAVKLVPSAIVLASLPESEVEAGSQRGVAALRALEKAFGRLQALWKPVATEEAFEIVRRRLFVPVRDLKARDEVCRAFADAYIAEGVKLPSETQQRRYHERLAQAYPIHPEIFDRLYEDWTTIDGFQRTRGVLKLMAKVIFRLWKDDNKDLMILPGSLPLHDSGSRNELTYYLPAGWDAVIERDIDGDRAETIELENKETRFGQLQAARRVARSLFLGSAPSSVVSHTGIRGLDRARILLGCIQPGQTLSIYSDALNRLCDRLHYLNSSGDKALDNTRYWFDTRANLRREMEDRKRRFSDDNEVTGRIAEALKRVTANSGLFDGVHIFTPHADVPDDESLRLVVLSPKIWHSREETRISSETAMEFVRNNGAKPRYRGNRLIFLVADHGALARLKDVARVALAWDSIVTDVKEGRLNIDLLQQKQAEKELLSAQDVVPRAVRECYRWLLCPTQDAPTAKLQVEPFQLNSSASAFGPELDRVCLEHELVVKVWSPIHLRKTLIDFYWKPDKSAQPALAFWEDTLRYAYLPRLRNREVLSQAIRTGATTRDFFGIAYGTTQSGYDGFQLGTDGAQLDDTLLLVEPAAAAAYQAQELLKRQLTLAPTSPASGGMREDGSGAFVPGQSVAPPPAVPGAARSSRPRHFHVSVDVPAATAKMRMVDLADEIIAVLSADPNASVKVSVEIAAEFPEGAADNVKRAVLENASSLKLPNAEWE